VRLGRCRAGDVQWHRCGQRVLRLTILLIVLLPRVAAAHAHLVQAVPANDSVLAQPPPSFMLLFNEAARLTALSLQQDDASPRKIGGLPGTPSARWLIPAPVLAPGNYTLTYRVLSEDGHIMSGSIKSRIREP
jgi:methionine-rich copper-binding protein CopC